jgi:uncharacterized membrane protein
MSLASDLNIVGLIFDILGVIILFRFGPPVIRLTPERHQIVPYNAMDDSVTRKNQAKYRKHARMSKLGMVCLLLGFAFQLSATIVR